MTRMLICTNAACRFLVDLRGGGRAVSRSALVTGGCPECKSEWSSQCPACSEVLVVAWTGHHAHCAACNHPLQPQKSRASARAA